jgi:hypothetical protein
VGQNRIDVRLRLARWKVRPPPHFPAEQ